MTPPALLDSLKTTLQKSKVEKLALIAAEQDFSTKELIDLTFHQEEKIAFRAAWVLENVFSLDQERFLPYATYFLAKLPDQNNLSARRHYSKILALMTKKNAPVALKEIVVNYDTEILVNTVFGWLIDEKVPVAVKSHGLNILANLNTKHNWIKEELLQTMDFLVDKESIAFFGKAKKIRKQLM